MPWEFFAAWLALSAIGMLALGRFMGAYERYRPFDRNGR